MAKNIKTRKGADGNYYPYTSPDIVIDANGKSVTTKFNELETKIDSSTSIDDANTAENKTWSSSKISSQFKDIAKLKNDVRMKDVSITPEDTTFATIIEGDGGTVNLYDKNNSNDKKLTVSSTLTNITSASSLTSFVLPIKPNTVYTLEKVLSNRFWYATTTDEPDVNTTINLQENIVNKTKYTFTSTGNDNYLLVVYYKTDDTLTKEEIMKELSM